MTRTALAALIALAALAAPALAQGDAASDLAESRLRGCLLAGSSAAPRTGLREAVVAVRAYCKPQIDRVHALRVAASAAGLTGKAADLAEQRTDRALNDEIARAVANFTGLTL
ncbi:MAG: hypothetical protein ACTHKM_12035 [Tsuneonella sp.]